MLQFPAPMRWFATLGNSSFRRLDVLFFPSRGPGSVGQGHQVHMRYIDIYVGKTPVTHKKVKVNFFLS